MAPLKPKLPADAQDSALPILSVMVMIVLLKVAWIYTLPSATLFFLSLLLLLFATFHFLLFRSSLAGDRLALTLSGSGIGAGSLPANGQSLSVSQTPV